MRIGIPKEILEGETRVATTPDTVQLLTKNGLEVIVEAGAGKAAHFTDDAYMAAGAKVAGHADVMACDIVAKVRKPSASELAVFKKKTASVHSAFTSKYGSTFYNGLKKNMG